jgi:hypothetical protein
MNKLLLLSFSALMLIATSADAAERQSASRVVSTQGFDESKPVLSFPKGCEGRKCDFTIHVAFFPAHEFNDDDLELDQCLNDQLEEPYDFDACNQVDQCVAWVNVANVSDLRSGQGRSTDGDGQVYQKWTSLAFSIARHEWIPTTVSDYYMNYRGKNREMLLIETWELETRGRGRCYFGGQFFYADDSRIAYRLGID